MSWNRTLFTIALPHMAHRPPLPKRWALYCVVAYIIPILMLELLPDGAGFYKEISWLTTLAPAFILSLHYGMLGAFAGLIAGSLLYFGIRLALHVNLLPVNDDVLIPIYISYMFLAVAVGWLSQQLHDFYTRLIKAERLAAIGEVAVTIRHEVNNALAAITGEAGLLRQSTTISTQDRAGADTILEMALRISADVRKLTHLEDAPTTAYLGGQRMVDVAALPPPRPAEA